MLRSVLGFLLLCPIASAQQILVDPYLRNSTAWTVINPAVTSIVSWAPLTIETRVTNSNQGGTTVGVYQNVSVPRSGFYQLAVHANTAQLGQSGSMSFHCSLGTLINNSGRAYYGPDTRMNAAFLSAGNHRLELSSTAISDASWTSYRMIFEAVFLYAVDLPCPHVNFISDPSFWTERAELHGTFSPGATFGLWILSTHPQAPGISISGIAGELLLDPTLGSGLVFTPRLDRPNFYTFFGFQTDLYPRPALYLQILEFDPTQSPGSQYRLGSRTYTRF